MITSDISEKNCLEIAKLLNHLLASEYVLYTKTWKFHWNIEGKHFGAMHTFFDAQRIQLGEFIDEIAERVRALNVKSDGTLAEFLEKSSLAEHPGQNPDDLEMIKILLNDHEKIIKKIRQDSQFINTLGDYGTNNLLCDLLEKHEKMAWMLRAFLN